MGVFSPILGFTLYMAVRAFYIYKKSEKKEDEPS